MKHHYHHTAYATANKRRALGVFSVLVMVCVYIYMYGVAGAAFNPEINYQGKLTNNTNVAVADGSYHMRFRLYTGETGGTLVHLEDRSNVVGNRVSVVNGLFSVMLGSSSPLTSVNFDQPLWLEVEVAGTASSSPEILTPRKRLGAVPAAFVADTLDGLDSTQFVRTDTTSTIASTSATTLLTITQSGTGDILNVMDGATEVFTILDGGNIGIGSTSPTSKLVVDGGLFVSGNATATNLIATSTLTVLGQSYLQSASTTNLTIASRLFDGVGSSGSNGMILQTTGAGVQWVSTSTLGILGNGSIDTSAELAAILTDETGTAGFVVFSQSPTFTGTALFTNSSTTNATTTFLSVRRLFDNNGSGGTTGQILQSNGSTTQWISTSTLGFLASADIDTCSEFAGIITGETGTCGAIVLSVSPTFTGTTTHENIFATNATTTGVLKISSLRDASSSLGSNGMILQTNGSTATWVATSSLGFLTTSDIDTSVELRVIVTNETGTGALVFNADPTFVGTAIFNAASTTNASTTLLSVQKLFDINGSAGTNGQILQSNGSTTQWISTSTLGFLAAGDIDTSSELAGVLTDETGTAGSVVFSGSPTLTGTTTVANLQATNATTSGVLKISSLRDSASSLGSNGMILQTNGSTATWVATSTLGFIGTDAIDTCSEFAAIMAGETGTCGSLVFSASPTFTGTAVFSNASSTNASTTYLTIAKLFDGTGSAGSNGMVLQSNGSTTQWVATSSLGVGAGSGTVNSGDTGYFAYYPSTGTTVDDQSVLNLSGTNIGIGTTSPYGMLSVTNTGSGPSFVVEDATSPDQTPFIIDSTGKVGIGSSSPTVELVVSSANPSFIVDDSDAASSQLEFVVSGATAYIRSGVDSSDTAARFRVVRSGTTATNIANFDIYATTTFLNGFLGIGTTTPQSEIVVHDASSDSVIAISGSNSANRGLQFNLLDGSAAWTQYMDTNEDLVIREYRSGNDDFRIQNTAGTDLLFLDTSAGTLGLGTSTPTSALTVVGAGLFTGNISGVNMTATGTLTVSGAGTSTFSNGLQTATLRATGAVYDGAGSAGTNGMVLQTSGTGVSWVATSTLGLGGGGSTNWTDNGLYLSPLTAGDGILATGSSTIGGSTQATGLTILGGATTTGYLTVQGAGTSTFTGGLQAAALSVTGAATSTFANGINIATGCYAVNGTCLNVGGGSSNWTDNGLYLSPLTAGDGVLISGSSTIGGGTDITGLTILGGATTTGKAYFGGNVGIGSTSPTSLLSVHSYSGYTGTLFTVGSTTATGSLFTILNNGRVGIGTTSPSALLSIQGLNAQTNSLFDIRQFTASSSANGSNINTFTISSTSNVGIRTNNPTQALEVAGTIKAHDGGIFGELNLNTDGMYRSAPEYGLYGFGTRATSTVTSNNAYSLALKSGSGSATSTGFNFDTAGSGSIAPFGITTHNGFLWVIDAGDAEVYQYTTSGTYTGVSFDTAGSGNVNPHGGTAYNGFFWVTDTTDAEVYQYTTSGTYTGVSFDTAGSGNISPQGITAYNGFLWVTDNTADEVYQYTANGTYTGFSFDIAASGNDVSQGITAYNGFLWVTDSTDDEVYQYTTSGTYTGVSFDTAASGNTAAFGITAYNGFFWVTDNTADEVYQYTIPSTGGYMTFSTDGVERLRIATTTGNIGIGTTTPNWSLQVASATPYIAITDTNAGTNGKQWFITNNNGVFSLGTTTDNNYNATSSLLSITNASTTFARALYVTGAGTSTFTGGLQAAALSVTGAATSTFANGINIATGCYAVNGTCLNVGGGSTNWVDNGLYLSPLTAGDGILTTGSSTIGGGTDITGLTILGGATTTGKAYFAGNVGIGTTSPTSLLSVHSYSGYTGTLFTVGSTTATGSLFTILNNGRVGIGTTSPSALLSIQGLNAQTNSLFDIRQFTASSSANGSNINTFTISSTSNIGIRTNNPTQALEVAGTIKAHDGGIFGELNLNTDGMYRSAPEYGLYGFGTRATSTVTSNNAYSLALKSGSGSATSTGFNFDTAGSGSANPEGITAYDGFFWVTDQGTAEVYKYTTSGTYTGVSFDTAASGNSTPIGITAYNGFFWVTDQTDGEIYQYTTSGTYTGVSFDTAASGDIDPVGITAYNGFFWITSLSSDEVRKYNLNGVYTGTSFNISASGNADPRGITGYNGFFWITDSVDAEFYQYTTSGVYTGVRFDTAGSGNSLPRGSTIYNGFFWATDGIDAEVYQYTIPSTGGYMTFSTDGVERLRIATTTGNIGIGTTTPNWSLQVASATPYIGITDTNAGAGGKQWFITNNNGVFSLGTTTDNDYAATSSLLTITNASTTFARALAVSSTGTSTFAGGINVTGGCVSVNSICITGGGSSNWTDGGLYLSPLTAGDGILVTGSSTIGGGTDITGLTILGGATTTGNLVVQGAGTSTFANGLQTGAFAVAGVSTSTFANGLNINAGCYAVAGQCLNLGSGSTNWVDNGLYLSPLGAGDGVLITGSSTITSLSVTNGTTTNATTTNLKISSLLDSASSLGTNGMVLQSNGSVATWVATSTLGLGGGGSGTVNAGVSGYFSYYPSDGTTVDDQTALFLSGSNIGVGTTTPASLLTVAGNGLFSGNLQAVNITATGTLAVTGATTLSSTLGVTGHSTFTTASTTNLSANSLAVGQTGTTSVNSAGTLFSRQILVGTSSSPWDLQIASTTPYFALTDTNAGANAKQWLVGNSNGIFTIGSTTDNNFNATSSLLSITNSSTTLARAFYVTGAGTSTITAGGVQSSGLHTTWLRATGALYDGANSAGTNGMVLQTSGSGVTWVATSTLGIGGTNYFTNSGASTYLTTGTNLGIGTSTPFAKLSIHANSGDPSTLFAIGSTTPTGASTTLFSVTSSGLTTIGDASGTGDANFQFAANENAWSIGYSSTTKSFNIASSTDLSNNVALTIQKTGLNVGISSTSPWRTLSVNGTVAFNGLSAVSGTDQSVCIDPTSLEITTQAGDTCAVSSARYKHDVETLPEGGLSLLRAWNPVSFIYNNDPASTTYWGFIAEEMASSSPELAAWNPDGTVQTINSVGISAITVKALQELDINLSTIASATASSTESSRAFAQTFFENMFARVTSFLADASNNVDAIFANRLRAKEEICVDDQCLSRDDVRALIDMARSQTAASGNASGNQGSGGTVNTNTGSTTGTTTVTVIGDTTGDLSVDDTIASDVIDEAVDGENGATIDVFLESTPPEPEPSGAPDPEVPLVPSP